MIATAQETLIEYIKENQDKLYRIAYTYTNNKEQSLDVVQEAITKALEHIGSLRHEEYVKTWFYRILINEAIKASRSKNKIIEYELLENVTQDKSYEEELVENIDIYKNIQMLNDKIKTVILLRYFENMKIEEIAIITKTNVSTVKSRLYKGIKELKISLERRNCI